MVQKKKILFSVQMIRDIGGISSSILNLINELYSEYDITLCVSCGYLSPNVILPDDIKVIKGSSLLRDAIINRRMLSEQGIMQKAKRFLVRVARRIFGIRTIIKTGINKIEISGVYDVAIAFAHDRYCKNQLVEGGDYDFVLRKVNANRKVAWMHTDLRKDGYNHDICLNVFRDFDAIVNVSEDSKAVFDAIIPEYINKSFVVYNTYNIHAMKEMALAYKPYINDGKIHIITVARVTRPKKIERIIEACRRLKDEGIIGFKWYVVGDGDEFIKMKDLVKEKEVSDLISFEGIKTNPYPYMYYADVFVLTSDFEGYGMTPREAQILGCPALITNFGPAHEVVDDGITGMICENSTEGVYSMIKQVLTNPSILTRYRENLKKKPITNQVALNQFKEVCGL